MTRFALAATLFLVVAPATRLTGRAEAAIYNLHLVTDNAPDYTNIPEHRESGDVTRSHTELVQSLHEYVINTAGFRDPTMNWVRMNLQGYGPRAEEPIQGYSDGDDVGTRFEPDEVTYRATMSAVTRGGNEVFFTATGMGTVVRWDGNSWAAAPIQCEDGGMLSLAGDVVTLFTAGKANRRWKGLDWSRQTVLRYYRRSGAGQWEGPRDLTDEFEIHEYRSLPDFSVPPYAPANYIPLVWSDFGEGTSKLLKVPFMTDK